MKAKASQMWSRLTTMLFVLFCFTAAWAQKTVTGTVVDNQGEPIPGVNVVVKGTTNGAMTDIDGNFSIAKVDENAVLHVSFVGYAAQEVPVAGKTVFKIELAEDSQLLDEVVAIGYGTAKKGNLTGAVAKVNSEKLGDRPITDVSTALQGQMAGVEVRTPSGQPGGETQIRVRGAASIHASSDPLYVVDGVATDNISSINPSDIASIEVLKDASSSAIYGSRGANGVVLVTTKHGKSGKARVEFASTWGWQQAERKVDMASAEEWIWAKKYAINKSYVDKFGAQGATANDDYMTRYQMNGNKFAAGYMYDPRWDNGGKGISQSDMSKYPGVESSTDLTQDLAYLDWQDEFFQGAPMQQYQLSVSGGVDKTSYRISSGWLDQDGIAVGTGFKRLTLRANVDSQVNKYFQYGLSVAPSFSWQTLGAGVDGKDSETHHALSMVPVVESLAGNKTGSEPYATYTWAGSTVSPTEKMLQTDNQKDVMRMLSSAYMKFDFTHGVTASVTGSWDFYDYEQRQFIPSGIVNSSTWKTSPEGSNSSNTRTDYRSNKFAIEALLNYHKEIKDHDIQAMLGWGDEEKRAWNTQVKGTGFPNNALENFTTSTATTINTATADISTRTRLVSFFGRVQYDFASRYLLTASLRRDGSSLFGKNAKWGWFPAVSGAWRVSNEAFWPENFWMNNFKIRGSYGKNGNNSIPATAALATLSVANYSWNGASTSGYSASAGANPDLGWEITTSWNVALDFGFLENRINLSLDYYDKTTSDLLYQVQVPALLGYTSAWGNIGKINNRGLEIELSSTNIQNRNFTWNTSLNMGFNTNEVKELADHQTVFTGAWSTQVLMEGEAINSFYLYETDGVFTEEKFNAKNSDGSYVYPRLGNQIVGDYIFKDTDHDGKITADDRTIQGAPTPTMTWGLTNSFKYKDFDLSVLLTGQAGGKIYGLLGRAIDRTGMGPAGNVTHRWVNAYCDPKYLDSSMAATYNWDGKTPLLTGGTNSTSNYTGDWLYSSDFVKIKNITLGWNCKYAKRIGLENLRVYGSIENVFSWDNYDYFSVESNKSAGSTNGIGGNNDYGAYPNARVYSLGVNLTF